MRFEFEKETKGSIRFKETSENPAIGTIYIRKDHLKDMGLEDAKSIEVEIKRGEK